jgi:hypothetical protein
VIIVKQQLHNTACDSSFSGVAAGSKMRLVATGLHSDSYNTMQQYYAVLRWLA